MRTAALLAALLTPVIVGAAAQTPRPSLPRIVCLSMGETRDLFSNNALVAPFRAMREASQAAQAEAIDIQLCRAQGILVYNVTLLDEDGRVMHKLVGAANGTLLTDREADGLGQPQAPGRLLPPDPLQQGR